MQSTLDIGAVLEGLVVTPRFKMLYGSVGWIVVTLSVVARLCAQEEQFLLLRAESLTLLPQSKPMLYVQVANVTEHPVDAEVSVKVPESWRMQQVSQQVVLAAGQQRRLGFSMTAGAEQTSNCYPVEITARGAGRTVARRQAISVASAPYFKPTIDGDPSDWQDAIPVSFTHRDKKTTIATCWNRRQFSLLVSVEETQLVRRGTAPCFDAVQLVMAAGGTETGRSVEQEAGRFEYLVFADAAGGGCCCKLVEPGLKLSEVARKRPLDPALYTQAQVAVRRQGSTTHYEMSLPLADLRDHIKPSEGREFFLSVLVHDPDDTGVREWAAAAGLWDRQRNRLAWSDWEGAQWGDAAPLDCRTEWGMCSSRY